MDITDKLSSEQIERIKHITVELRKRKIGIGYIEDYDILSKINQNPPISFNKEVFLLSSAHKEKDWPKGRPIKIHLSKKDRITAFWEIHVSRSDLIDLIHDEYGMLPGTWKAKRFENLYEAYLIYRGRKLTDKEIYEIRKIKEENPKKISIEWVREKIGEMFPGEKAAEDIKSIRRILGWKENE